MTNFTAILLITATTNWVNIGTFIPNNGPGKQVEQLQVVTNHVLHVEYRYTTQDFFLGKDMGPVLKERKVDIPMTITNYGGSIPLPWHGWQYQNRDMTNGIILLSNGFVGIPHVTNTFPRSDR